MATLHNTTSSTPLIPPQVSILDLFIPGSTGILAIIEMALSINSYARPLLVCALLLFLGRQVCKYFWGLAETYFGSLLLPFSPQHLLTASSFNNPRLTVQ